MEVDDRRQANSLAESVGLQDFPSNVLINIFAKACPSPYDRRLLFGLSLVCNKFAGVLRQPSVLWNVMLLSLPRQAPSLPSAKAALDQLLQEGPRLASFVAWALPRAAGVRELTVRFTNHHQAMKFQVLVGLFGVSLRTLGLSPGCHGAVPLQQPTINLIGYCTGLERLELTSDGVMTRDLSPLSLLQKLQLLQITSFNDPVRYPIPPAVLTVTSLRELSMRALGLNLIQDAVSSLQDLEVLEIVGARGLRIQGGLGQLGSLKELELNACEMSLDLSAAQQQQSWCPSLSGLTSLTSLSFLAPRNFGLVIPPPVTELVSLRRLKLLRVVSKQFAPLLLPPGFANLGATLTELVLECTDWPAIPQAVFALTGLRLLAIRASGLRKLTAEVAMFGALRRLDLSRNRELDVRDDIPWAGMTALRSLDLSECRHLRVTTGLVGLAELPALKMVSLHGCTAATQAADTALNKLLKALKSARPQRVKVIILRKDVDYTLHDVDDMDVS
ncbi:L domain-like protein [Coccomyxa subellipsoidea C-169]|uniref:L domain-like protein n=1 Tax=Coccomyxa subellipsoidea (strain C-169) TaxID=574566 RepID=I0YW41_COCSC|nr:L domain-like protein [Coccomyxa subellipsoidea C-169]EIE22610.1 L domain-like protein [Coccomyxa subellipsoidea C-169]|eukprot:XP_005647154.1 L domain-like protein [Coccomyxa subellipsoidea C-169]